MKVDRPAVETVDVATIRLVLPVKYGEEDIPTDFPGRANDMLTLNVDLDTMKIREWPAGREACDLHMKVTDSGCYYALDQSGAVIGTLEQEYVPGCVPGSYGDYVELEINADGVVTNWELHPDEITGSFWPDKDDE